MAAGGTLANEREDNRTEAESEEKKAAGEETHCDVSRSAFAVSASLAALVNERCHFNRVLSGFVKLLRFVFLFVLKL